MSLKSVAEDYFSTLNPIAARLCSDMNEIKSSYEELWNSIPEKEQQNILTESIIKPEISIKYLAKEEKPRTDYAVNLIFDGICSYRDEHSGPFSFKTRSQRDLTIFHSDEPATPVEGKRKTKVKPKAPPVPNKDVTPDILPEVVSVNSDTGALPKTGLDFLYNW